MSELTSVPLVAHENALNRYQKIIKWLLTALILSNLIISCLFGFLWYTSGTYEELTAESVSAGNANINTGEGDISN